MAHTCDELAQRTAMGSAANKAGVAPWPGGASFALFLSHDIDQVYDREMFRILGDINHFRRVLLGRVPGSARLCFKRILRSLLNPRRPGHDIDRMLETERSFGFRSTFFLLEDRTFNRLGGRYTYADPAIGTIATKIVDSGCEIAVHGAYYNFNNAERYRAQAQAFRSAFGRAAKGIRNHDLRHDGAVTWKAQRDAGFRYDSSFGFNDVAGVRDGFVHPFFPLRVDGTPMDDFVVVPMTIMDSAIFRQMRLSAPDALALCKKIAEEIMAAEGVLGLNWHNNYFAEEEFSHWQEVYEEFLGWLLGQQPWHGTGEEIADWWVRRSLVRLSRESLSSGRELFVVESGSILADVVVRIRYTEPDPVVTVDGEDASVRRIQDSAEIRFRRLGPDRTRVIRILPRAGGLERN